MKFSLTELIPRDRSSVRYLVYRIFRAFKRRQEISTDDLGGFCVMPWVHAYADAQGRRGLCCLDQKTSTSEIPSMSLERFWNSNDMKSVRKQMIRGEAPESCKLCFGPSVHQAVTLRSEMNYKYRRRITEIKEQTHSDGTTVVRPSSFDYRSSNCNFLCRTCGPDFSTAAEAERLRHANLRAELGTWSPQEAEAHHSRRNSMNENRREEILSAARERRLRELYWAGGEPLLDPIHWEVMDTIVRESLGGSIKVSYNTNLSRLEFRGHHLADYAGAFESFHVNASIDGVGALGEYIRTGFKTELFRKNLRDLRARTSRLWNFTVFFDLTLTSVGLLHLGDVLEFALQENVPMIAKATVPSRSNSYLAVEFLPEDVKNNWCRKWISWIDKNDRRRLLVSVKSLLELMLKKPSFENELTSEKWRVLRLDQRKVISAFESCREFPRSFAEFLEVDPRLNNWL